MTMLGWFVLRKIIRISKIHRITSIADFIASRYGKSTTLGGIVAFIAVDRHHPIYRSAAQSHFNLFFADHQ